MKGSQEHFHQTWHKPENKAMCRLVTRRNAETLDEQNWPVYFEWLTISGSKSCTASSPRS